MVRGNYPNRDAIFSFITFDLNLHSFLIKFKALTTELFRGHLLLYSVCGRLWFILHSIAGYSARNFLLLLSRDYYNSCGIDRAPISNKYSTLNKTTFTYIFIPGEQCDVSPRLSCLGLRPRHLRNAHRDSLHPALELRGEQPEEGQQEDDHLEPLGQGETRGVRPREALPWRHTTQVRIQFQTRGTST